MPQDRLRSVVYRSFVTCDDPKGVADSKKTIRKSKKAEPRVKKTTSHEDEERGELQKLSDFQVMEVSRGAEKLSEVIGGSLSNRPSFDYDTTSNHIATDLLRGALDLQDSLVMLGKFQEASNFITNKKEKKKKFCDLSSFEDGGFEKPRISASRDCYDELREVIKESFARQNLLPRLEVDVDLPSSSSSSSLNYAHSSPLRIRGGEKMKGSNLIAKLMGLEEVPSKAGAIFMKVEKERVPYKRGLLLDIDLPRAKKPEFMVKKKVVRERRTLEEIIETMQFKGILERKCVDVDGYNDCKLYSNPSFLSRELTADQGPPIVIMKPLPLRGEEPRFHRDCINGGEDFKSRQLRSKMREEFSRRPHEKSSVKQKVDKGREEKNVGKVQVRPVKKAVDSQDRVSTKKMNQSKPLLPQTPKKEGVQKIEKIAKAAKPQRSDKPQDLAKLTIVKQSRNVRENNVPKGQILRAKVAAADKSTKPKKNLRNGESKRKPSSASVENRQGDGNSTINTEIIIGEAFVKNQEPERTILDVTATYYTSDNSRNEARSPSDASGPITKDNSNHIEDDSYIPSFDSDQIKGWKGITNTRHLLLGSISFLNHIEELFDTGAHDCTVFYTTCLHDSELLHDSLLLDCAKEILQHKSLHCMSMRNQWSENFSRRPKYHLPIEKLVDEVSSSIEDLQNYSKSCGDLVLADSTYPMLERDLWWNEEVTGSWDSGWRKGYPIEAVDEVMHDLEELVLSEIVAGMITEIM